MKSTKRKKRTQRVDEFKNNFHSLFESGMKISQISSEYDVDVSYAYKLLEEIANQNGVTRNYYLEQEHVHNNNSSDCDRKNSYTHYEEEHFKAISESFDNCLSDIIILSQKIESMRKEEEEKDCVEKEC